MGGYRSYLPSGTWILAVVMPLVALGGILLLFYSLHGTETASPISSAPAFDSKTLTSVLLETDTDNDGLKDWEESLWGTKNNTNDSDGDGTNDAAEVAAERNPALAGPNDRIEADTEVLARESASSSALIRSAPADYIAQSLFGGYLALKQTGNLTPETVGKLITNVVDTSTNSFVSEPKHQLSEFQVIDTNPSEDSLNTYKLALKNILAPLTQVKENEFVVLMRYMQEQKIEDAALLQKSASLYQKTSDDLLKMPVPQAILGAHMVLANSFALFADIVEKMRHYNSNPLAMLLAIKEYEQNDAKVRIAGTEIQQYLLQNNRIAP